MKKKVDVEALARKPPPGPNEVSGLRNELQIAWD